MKKFLVGKEIERIKELLGNPNKQVVSEQVVAPLLKKFLGGRLVSKMESSFGDDVVVNLEKLFGKGATSIIADANGKVFVLSRSGTKVPMSTIRSAVDAVASGRMTAEEVTTLLPRTLKDGTEFRSVFTNELKNAIPKPKPTGTPRPSGTPKPPNSSDLTYAQSFGKGLQTTQAPFLFLKMAGRNVPVPLLRGYLRSKIQKLSNEEAKRVGAWFFTGAGDVNSIVKIFNEHGIGKSVANLSGQLVSKWIFWSTAFSVTNLLIDLSKDLDDEIYTSDLDAIGTRIIKNSESANLQWLVPIGVVWEQLISPLFRGGIVKFQKKQFQERLEKIRNRAKTEGKKVNDEIKSKKPKVDSLIDKLNPNKYNVDSLNNKLNPSEPMTLDTAGKEQIIDPFKQ